MYGIKSMCGIFEPNRKKTCMELKSMGGNFVSNKKNMYRIKSIGGNFEPNRKKHVWNKKYGWKF